MNDKQYIAFLAFLLGWTGGGLFIIAIFMLTA